MSKSMTKEQPKDAGASLDLNAPTQEVPAQVTDPITGAIGHWRPPETCQATSGQVQASTTAGLIATAIASTEALSKRASDEPLAAEGLKLIRLAAEPMGVPARPLPKPIDPGDERLNVAQVLAVVDKLTLDQAKMHRERFLAVREKAAEARDADTQVALNSAIAVLNKAIKGLEAK